MCLKQTAAWSLCACPLKLILQCILGYQRPLWGCFILWGLWPRNSHTDGLKRNLFSGKQVQEQLPVGNLPSHRKYWPPKGASHMQRTLGGPSCYYNTQSFKRPPRSSPTLQHCCDITGPALRLADDAQGVSEMLGYFWSSHDWTVCRVFRVNSLALLLYAP